MKMWNRMNVKNLSFSTKSEYKTVEKDDLIAARIIMMNRGTGCHDRSNSVFWDSHLRRVLK